MTEVDGIDQYSGGLRHVAASAERAHILLTCDGSDGSGEALLTPDQARKLGRGLVALANEISVQFAPNRKLRPEIVLACRNDHKFTTQARGGSTIRCPECGAPKHVPVSRP